MVARALLPWASTCELLPDGGKPVPMTRLHASGVFEVEMPGTTLFRYRFRVTYPDGVRRDVDDPYRFLPTISEEDLFLLGKGDDHRAH